MKVKLLFIAIAILFSFTCVAQDQNIPQFVRQQWFDDSLRKIIIDCKLDSLFDANEDGMERISFAVIDLNGKKPLFGGVNEKNFIYPASVYKMYVAMEILKQVSEKKYSLYRKIVVQAPNDVDRSSEISWDPRPLLKAGDTVTIDYLLDLMITRSDNSAANCLIDVAGRENINRTMNYYGWEGSEVTRKFLSRKFEDTGYDTVKSTETNALHAASFMYRVYNNSLINPWVSQQIKVLLGRQLDTTKLQTGFPPDAMFYHKTGWWDVYTNDVGIVNDGKTRFVISLFTPVKEEWARPRMKMVAERVFALMNRIHVMQ